jgi:glycosyltransferase involved in cell wall biosynthesis
MTPDNGVSGGAWVAGTEGSERQGEGLHNRGRVTVVIPCYNQGRFLSEAVESVLSQSYQELEVVVVDDGSTDKTAEVAHSYTRRDSRVRLVRQANRGLAGARNRGLEEARGVYIVFLDADDRLLPGAIEVGVRELESHPDCAFVSGICRKITADGYVVPEWEQFRVRDDPYLELLRSCPIYVPAVMYRRSVFEAVGYFDSSYKAAEDYDLYYRILQRFPAYCHNMQVAEIRRHDTNMTHDRITMLKYNMSALRSQRNLVKGDARYREAYKAGQRLWRDWHGTPVVKQVRMHLQEGRWGQSLKGLLALLRYYPQGLPLLAQLGVERDRVARRLRHHQRELETHEYILQQLRRLSQEGTELDERRDRELRGAKKKERRRIRHHKERIRHLTLLLQILGRRWWQGWLVRKIKNA